MMRYSYSVCLLIGATGLSLATATTACASSGKGDKGIPVVSTTESKATHSSAVVQSCQKEVVSQNRVAESTESASVDGVYISPMDRLKQQAAAVARGETSSPPAQTTTTVVIRTTHVAKTDAAEEAPAPAKRIVAARSIVTEKTTLTVKTAEKVPAVEKTLEMANVPANSKTTVPAKLPLIAKSSEPDNSPAPARTTMTSKATISVRSVAVASSTPPASLSGRLARVTAYWACEGDYYTRHGIASTGVRLHDGHCAVDPNIIPYGSVVTIAGVGKFLAVDTGSAVISRMAAREAGHTSAERNAIVVDVYFDNRSDGERFASSDAKWASVSWWTPGSTGSQAKEARGLFAEEDWTKINGKQL